MKNYLIGTLVVIIVFLLTVVYKQQNTFIFTHFPVQEKEVISDQSSQAPRYLFLFFSKKNCANCGSEIVDFLNKLSPPFYVVGVVPGNELKDEKTLRRITGAAFPLRSFEEYKRYVPWYTPMLIGVSPPGKIVFVLPGISVTKTYLKNFLKSVHDKLRTQ